MALPVKGSTHLIPAYYSFYRPRKDEWLSWPSWLTYSGRLTDISGHPSAAGRAQYRESSPARDRRSTTVPRHQHGSLLLDYIYGSWDLNGIEILLIFLKIGPPISEYRRIYPQLVEVELVGYEQLVIISVYGENKLIEVKLTLLWGTLREVSHQLLTLIESEFGHWIHRSYLIELFHDSIVYVLSSGNDIGVIIICGRSPCLRCISCFRKKDQSADKQFWP